MTYEEYFWHLRELNKMCGYEATEQEIDEEIALVNQLPCTGGGPPKPLLAGQQEAAFVDVEALDAGEKFPSHPCPHCTWLAHYMWVKSMHEARRNGMPETPPPWLATPQ